MTGNMTPEGFLNLGQSFDGGRCRVQLVAPVIASHDPVGAMLDRQQSVFGHHDALEDDLRGRHHLCPHETGVVHCVESF